jgi:sulfhydrogenase subunit beta (sulfur reductase)
MAGKKTGGPKGKGEPKGEAKGAAAKRVSQGDVAALVKHLMAKAPVAAPVKKGDHLAFGEVSDPAAVVCEYTSTILPPKKYVFPQQEDLLHFDRKNAKAEAPDPGAKERILFAVHPCDMQGILRLDLAFGEGEPEEGYLARRKKISVVGASCVADDKCFCQFLGNYDSKKGFDVFLTKVDGGYLVEALTGKGSKLLEGFGKLQDASPADVEKAKGLHADRAKVRKDLGCKPEDLPKLSAAATKDPFWKETGDRCLSCGTCCMVCPTCYCFEVDDRLALDMNKGSRVRTWDSCQVQAFATVAGGENFREKREDRVQHRFGHKFEYFPGKYGVTLCVGCGRCSRSCVAHIQPDEEIAEVAKRYAQTVSSKV